MPKFIDLMYTASEEHRHLIDAKHYFFLYYFDAHVKKKVCMKWLLRNEIHSLLLDTNYEANVKSSFGIKTPLISLF